MDSPRKSSRASKLVQAAALAAVLVPLGSVAVETSPISHLYSGGGGGGATNNQLFDFGPYEFRLFFENLSTFASFFVTVDNQLTNQAGVNPRLGSFAGDLCVPLDPSLTSPCVDFVVTGPPAPNGPDNPGADTWFGDYAITISWDALTDFAFPNGPGNRIRILHNEGGVPGNGFDSDITTDGSYVPGPFDPAIGGRDDNFQSFLVVQRPLASDAVPEPATVLLVTTGVGLLYRRRRKQQAAESSAVRDTTAG